MFDGGLGVDTKFTFQIGETRYGYLTCAGIEKVLKFLSTYVELRSMSITMRCSYSGTGISFDEDYKRLAMIARTQLHYKVIEVRVEHYTIEHRKILTKLIIDMINSNKTLESVVVSGLWFTSLTARSFVNAIKNNKKVTKLELGAIIDEQFSLCAYIIRQCTFVTEFAIGSYNGITVNIKAFCELIDSIHSGVTKVRICTSITAVTITHIIKLIARSSLLYSLACGYVNAPAANLIDAIRGQACIKCIQIASAWSTTISDTLVRLLECVGIELIDIPNVVMDPWKTIPDNLTVLNLGRWSMVFKHMIERNNMITHKKIHPVVIDTVIALWNHPITDPYILAMIIAWTNQYYIIRKRFIDETAIAICNTCSELKS